MPTAEFDHFLSAVAAPECDPSLGGGSMQMHICIALLSSTILSSLQYCQQPLNVCFGDHMYMYCVLPKHVEMSNWL